MAKNKATLAELLTKSDVAETLKVSTRTVENLVKAGNLPAPIRLSNHPRWRRSELIAYLNAQPTIQSEA